MNTTTADRGARSRSGDTLGARLFVVPLGAGIALGLLSCGSDYLLRYPWSAIGNITGTWVAAAFAVGAVSSRGSIPRAAIAGLATLLVATVAYYLSTSAVWPATDVERLLPGVTVWSVVSVVAGPTAGIAGGTWRGGVSGSRWPLRPLAVGGLAAVLGAEALFLVLGTTDADYAVSATELLFASVLPLSLLSSRRDRLTAYLALAVILTAAVPLMAGSLPWVFRLAGSGW